MSLEIKILAGSESKKFLVDLEKLVKRMEAATTGNTEETEEEETEATEEGSEEESEETEESFGENEAEEEEPKSKKTKAKKISTEDINDACKAKLKSLVKEGMTSKKAFAQVKALLNKHFNTESVSEIEESDRVKALKVLST